MAHKQAEQLVEVVKVARSISQAMPNYPEPTRDIHDRYERQLRLAIQGNKPEAVRFIAQHEAPHVF